MIEVAALGELLIDFASISKDEDGYPTMAAHAGGAPANFLAALKKFGHDGALLGKVGDDAFGRMLFRTLERAGIGTSGLVVDDSVFTTLAFVTFDEKGDRSFSFARKPGADTQLRPDELNLSLIDEAKIFHFGTLSLTAEPVRSATQAAVARAKEKGKMITCDPNLRLNLWKTPEEAKEQMNWALRQADVVKISDEEVEFLWGLTPEEGADYLLNECGVSLAMVTLGPKGCFLKNRTLLPEEQDRGSAGEQSEGPSRRHHRRGRYLRRLRSVTHPGDRKESGGSECGRTEGCGLLRVDLRQPFHGVLRRHPQHP